MKSTCVSRFDLISKCQNLARTEAQCTGNLTQKPRIYSSSSSQKNGKGSTSIRPTPLISLEIKRHLKDFYTTSSPGFFSLALEAGRTTSKAREKRPGDEVDFYIEENPRETPARFLIVSYQLVESIYSLSSYRIKQNVHNVCNRLFQLNSSVLYVYLFYDE